MRGAKENPELAEVRAILLKVQRLGVEPEEDLSPKTPAPAAPPETQAAAPGSRAANIAVFDRKAKAIQVGKDEVRPAKKGLAIYLGITAGLIAVSGALYVTGVVSPPGEPAVLSQQDQEALLTEAHRLLSVGDVAGARTRLLQAGAERQADTAFVLAQSYDPNYLQSLPNANSAPDAPEAARWYKKWYELAVQSGLDMDPGRLQRIINAMQRH
jgi:hypothetical protein